MRPPAALADGPSCRFSDTSLRQGGYASLPSRSHKEVHARWFPNRLLANNHAATSSSRQRKFCNLTRQLGARTEISCIFSPRDSAATSTGRLRSGQQRESFGIETSPTTPLPWAELLHRVFSVAVLECPKCSGRMRILAAINPPEAIRKILIGGLRCSVSVPGRLHFLISFKEGIKSFFLFLPSSV